MAQRAGRGILGEAEREDSRQWVLLAVGPRRRRGVISRV